jgi:hypothetical protein
MSAPPISQILETVLVNVPVVDSRISLEHLLTQALDYQASNEGDVAGRDDKDIFMGRYLSSDNLFW